MLLYHRMAGIDFLGVNIPSNALYSFGNMGFAKPLCGKDLLVWNSEDRQSIQFQCERTTVLTNIVDVGIQISESLPAGEDNTIASCNSENLKEGSASMNLSQNYLLGEQIKTDFMSQCNGEQRCSFRFRTEQYFKQDMPEEYKGQNFQLFMQVQCKSTDE